MDSSKGRENFQWRSIYSSEIYRDSSNESSRKREDEEREGEREERCEAKRAVVDQLRKNDTEYVDRRKQMRTNVAHSFCFPFLFLFSI